MKERSRRHRQRRAHSLYRAGVAKLSGTAAAADRALLQKVDRSRYLCRSRARDMPEELIKECSSAPGAFFPTLKCITLQLGYHAFFLRIGSLRDGHFSWLSLATDGPIAHSISIRLARHSLRVDHHLHSSVRPPSLKCGHHCRSAGENTSSKHH